MKKKSKPIALGHLVRDTVTGVEGIAIHSAELLNGTQQMAVQPKADKKKDTAVPDAFSYDIQTLEYVGDGIADKVTPAPDIHVRIGDLCEDTVTGVKGITVQKNVYTNGCVYFFLQPKATKDKPDEIPKNFYASYDRLKVIEEAAYKPVKAKPRPVPAKEPTTGGPRMRACRI